VLEQNDYLLMQMLLLLCGREVLLCHWNAEEKCFCDLAEILGLPLRHSFLSYTMGFPLRLPDVHERQGLSLNLLSKLVMSFILEKHFAVLEYFPPSMKVTPQD